MDVTLVLTHDCNLGCGYCYAGDKFNRPMSRVTAERALDVAFEDRADELQLSFFGGEPLLQWDLLVDVAREARRRALVHGTRLRMSVTTNGTLLNAERASLLDQLEVYVGLSIDGIQEAHDAGRPRMGGGSSFHDTARGLDVLLQRGTPFETISVVTPSNVRWLGRSVRWLLEKGVPRIGLNPCYEAYFTDMELELYARGLEESAQAMVEAYRDGHIVSMPVFDNKIMAALKGGLSEADKCSLGETSIAVAPSGNVYPCERLVGEDEDHRWLMGNVLDGFRAREAGQACARGPVNDECGDCAESWRCASFCACANVAETGRTEVAGGTQCWHERVTAELADRVATTLWEERNRPFLAWFYGRMSRLGAVAAAAAGDARDRAGAMVRSIPRENHGRLRLTVVR